MNNDSADDKPAMAAPLARRDFLSKPAGLPAQRRWALLLRRLYVRRGPPRDRTLHHQLEH